MADIYMNRERWVRNKMEGLDPLACLIERAIAVFC
jgi:hypothetical protein